MAFDFSVTIIPDLIILGSNRPLVLETSQKTRDFVGESYTLEAQMVLYCHGKRISSHSDSLFAIFTFSYIHIAIPLDRLAR